MFRYLLMFARWLVRSLDSHSENKKKEAIVHREVAASLVQQAKLADDESEQSFRIANAIRGVVNAPK